MPGLLLLFYPGRDRGGDYEAAPPDLDDLQLPALNQAPDGTHRDIAQLLGGFFQRPEEGHDASRNGSETVACR